MTRSRWMALTCAIGLAAGLSPAAQAQEAAKSADSFVNTMGVNTHLGWAGTPYTNYTSLKSALLSLGVRHIRDGITSIATDSTLTSQILDLGASGIHLQGYFDGNWYPVPVGSTPLSSVDVISKISALMPVLDIVEGPNETDNSGGFAYNNQGGFPAGTIAYDQNLYTIVKGSSQTSSLPVLVGSVGNSSKFPQMTAITPGPITYADYGDIHSYPGGKIADNGIDWCTGYATGLTGTKPIVCGETGYHNNTNYIGAYLQPGVSEAAAGKYMPLVFLEMFNRNIFRCLSYELVDQHADATLADGNGEYHFGLLRNDWTPKPAFTALKNTIALLQEPGASFTPTPLTYSVTTVPATVHHTLLQKSNGTYYLALWNDVSCYTSNTGAGGADVTNSTVQSTISLSSARNFVVYSPSDTSGTSSTSAYTVSSTASSITVNIPDRLLIIAISNTTTAPAAPTGLTATAGNTQVSLSWTASAGAASYNVYRSTSAGGEGTTPIATGITTTTYTNTGLTNGTKYYYKVAAVNSIGTSAQSSEASATPATGLPDLIVTGITMSPAAPVAGNHVVFTATVKNQGTAATPSGIVLGVSFWVDGTSVAFDATNSTSLAAGASVQLTASSGVNYWTATSGSHTVLANADDVNRITESTESNNTLSVPFTVTSAPTSSLQLQYRCGSTVANAIFLQGGLSIVNTGSTSIPYSQLKLRYWFTEDGTASQIFQCSSAPMGVANVTGTFVTMGTTKPTADRYLEIGFSSAAGSLAANASSGEIAMSINKSDYSIYNQANDWSWNSADTALTNWSHVTLYQNGTLVWGTEPQ